MAAGAAAYRPAIGRFATGVALVTTVWQERRYAMTASALTSVSLDPILLLVCLARDSQTRPAVRSSGVFGLSVLSGPRGREIAERCARSADPDLDQLEGIPLRYGDGGLPVLEGALAWAVCTVTQTLDSGSYDIAVATVDSIGTDDRDLDDPLVYFDGSYRYLAPHR
ncbi:MAG: flavin reductase family protein [Actinomycetia bacterium]|nr:flavin reductase family protein [Actinomycetes bacterium]